MTPAGCLAVPPAGLLFPSPRLARPLLAEARVRAGRLSDPAKIGAAADRVLRDCGVARCFVTTVKKGYFSWRDAASGARAMHGPASR